MKERHGEIDRHTEIERESSGTLNSSVSVSW